MLGEKIYSLFWYVIKPLKFIQAKSSEVILISYFIQQLKTSRLIKNQQIGFSLNSLPPAIERSQYPKPPISSSFLAVRTERPTLLPSLIPSLSIPPPPFLKYVSLPHQNVLNVTSSSHLKQNRTYIHFLGQIPFTSLILLTSRHP